MTNPASVKADPSQADLLGMNKRLLILLVLLGGLLFYFWQYVYGPHAAFHQYSSFMNEMYKLKFDKAKARILPTAGGSFEAARRFYTSNYTKFREGLFYPKYVIEHEDRSADRTMITLDIHQTVRADPPGTTSTFGTMLVAFKHRATMKREGIGWKIMSFSLAKTQLHKDHVKKTVTAREGGSGIHALVENIVESVQGAIAKVRDRSEHALEDPVPELKHRAQPQEGAVTFKLIDGGSVSGKIVTEDDVYYTLEDSLGNQTIVIKEDIAA